MYITAIQIEAWVQENPRRAQEWFPFLIGQLCYREEDTNKLDFPSGDSISKPGFDGILESEEGDAWIPKGGSVWEIGTGERIKTKADLDFNKRTDAFSEEKKAQKTFVFVTPRRWNGKSAWVEGKKKENTGWLDIRTYDADDLEQWLEQRPVAKIKFLEKINKSSRHIQSLEEFWLRWAKSCNPVISTEAFLRGRGEASKNILDKINSSAFSEREILPIAADSMEEASVFATAAILQDSQLVKKSLAITNQEGWGFVETITQPLLLIIAYDYRVQELPLKDNLLIITPTTISALSQSDAPIIKIFRPNIYEYEKALTSIGLSEVEALRTARNTGRSWLVFRRQNSIDGRLMQPDWVTVPQVRILPFLCLVGSWNSHKLGTAWYYSDTDIVSSIAGVSYSEIEQDLNFLLSCNDSPILLLNGVWKVKSPLELFFLFGDKITTDQLERFFDIVEGILSEADPQLELEPDKRWMASAYEKIRRQSREFIDAICDSLIKLAVLGPEISRLNQLSVEGRVRRLVGNVLDNAEPIRWLSLHSVLPALAEAAPDVFLATVDKSLAQAEQYVAELMRQSHSGGISGNCYHAGLLWALETLAWNPSYLSKVTRILLQLDAIKIGNNWGNTAKRSLLNIFCQWLPQTTASASERLEVLKTMAKEFPDMVVSLLRGLILLNFPRVDQTPKPKWRNVNVRANLEPTHQEINDATNKMCDYLIEVSATNTFYAIMLLDEIQFSSSGGEVDEILALIENLKDRFSPDEKEKIAQILRKKISWHELLEEKRGTQSETIEKLASLLDTILPEDIFLKHRWLFDAWSLPIKGIDELDYERRDSVAFNMREHALKEIITAGGVGLLDRLVEECKEPEIIGALLAYKWDDFSLAKWFVLQIPKAETNPSIFKLLNSFFRHRHRNTVSSVLQHLVDIGKAENWENAIFIAMFLSAPQLKETWTILDSMSQEIQNEYWMRISPSFLQHWETTLDYYIAKMTAVGRPRTALNSLNILVGELPPVKLFKLLQSALFSTVDDEPIKIESYYWKVMIERFEAEETINQEELIRVEFAVFETVQYEVKNPCRTLFKKYTSDPDFFLLLIDAAYKHDNLESKDIQSSYPEHVRSTSSKIIRCCKMLPGQESDGTVDPDVFKEFICIAQTRCKDLGKSKGCSIALGYMLVHAPEENEIWPPSYVCEVLEPVEQDVLRNQFYVGARNLRGGFWRGYAEGGDQERYLAKRYKLYQEKLQITYPNVSMLMAEIAASYENDARREDQSAELRLDGF